MLSVNIKISLMKWSKISTPDACDDGAVSVVSTEKKNIPNSVGTYPISGVIHDRINCAGYKYRKNNLTHSIYQNLISFRPQI